jgi:hypothetical protein
MGFCEKFYVPQVICDEIFCFTDTRTFTACRDVEPGATVSGTIDLHVTECDIAVAGNTIVANVQFLVQKELTVNQGDNSFDQEFAYRINRTFAFQACVADDIPPGVSLADLECRVLRLEFDESVVANADSNTIVDELDIVIKLKVVANRQVLLSLCPPNLSATVTIPTNNAG